MLISVARTVLVNIPVAWLGGRLFGRIEPRVWRWLVALLLGASALAALVRLLQ